MQKKNSYKNMKNVLQIVYNEWVKDAEKDVGVFYWEDEEEKKRGQIKNW